MNWDDLRIFLAVARSGQIGRAAPLLGLDATTVGRRLRRLERALGETLFEQQREGQRLTQAGAALRARAEQVDAAIHRAEEALPALGGVVRVSASEGFATWLLARHLPEFGARHPAITLDLVATNGFLSPSKRETDIAILLARPRRGPLVTRRLADYALGLYAARGYIEAHPPVMAAADLRAHRLIGYVPDFVYAPELDYLDEIAPGLEARLRSTSINAQHRIAASGGGVAVLPCFIGDADPALIRVLPSLRLLRSFWLATHEDTHTLPRVRTVTDWLIALAARCRARLMGE
jgi:DNA-binding transcriptional LysR family regulator